MNMYHNKFNKAALLAAVLFGVFSVSTQARPNIGNGQKKALLKTAAGCNPAEASIDLDINNVRAKLMTGGDMWWDIGIGEARYEVPKGSKKSSLFAGSVWIGGLDPQKQLKVAAQTYRQDGNDYWPGPLNEVNGVHTVDDAICSDWDQFWKVNKVTVNKFKEMVRSGNIEGTKNSEFESIWSWPARGNGFNAAGRNNNNTFLKARGRSGNTLNMDDREYAPYVEVGDIGLGPNDPTLYNPEAGDYPNMEDPGRGDQMIWWVFNDKGNIKQQTSTEAIGMEVQATAFAFATKNSLNDATFYNYRLVNWSTGPLDSTYIATWTDADLGWYLDDYIGCDTTRGLGILYNGNPTDGSGQTNSYGSQVPMVGIDFFQGPVKTYMDNGVEIRDTLGMSAFTYYNNNSNAVIGNPDNGVQIYFYMTGSTRNGQHFKNDFQGPGVECTGYGNGPNTNFVYSGDPGAGSTWSECSCGNPTGDRRFIHSSGPFRLDPGRVNDIVIGAIWVANVGGCPNTSFAKIKTVDDAAQTLFDEGFKIKVGPDAPRLVIREMDRKFVAYLLNDPTSSNYQEKFGYQSDPDSAKKYMVTSSKAKNAGYSDQEASYTFEGYRIFQLKNSQVTAANIFDDDGRLNEDLAREVFQTDVKNGVTQLVNRVKRIDVVGCDNCYDDIIKVEGKDSGIVHSFEITEDKFATGEDRGLVNYKTYYYIAIAYAYNNFKAFDEDSVESTQDVQYLESGYAAGGAPLMPVSAMPNPANGDMGTSINSDYGSGVVIQRLFGQGNDGVALQLSEASEAEAMTAPDYQSKQPFYEPGQGPAKIKVVDPLKVKPGNWKIYIKPDLNEAPPYTNAAGLIPEKSEWELVNTDNSTPVTIFKEKLNKLSEEILEEYGLSFMIHQTPRPADEIYSSQENNRNGYITSDVSFKDPSLAWLAGVPDQENRSLLNWIRSGGNTDPADAAEGVICDFSDVSGSNFTLDSFQFYESMLDNSSFTRATWAPHALVASSISNIQIGGQSYPCDFRMSFISHGNIALRRSMMKDSLQSVDLVFTSDKSKWSRCLVLEMGDDASVNEGGVEKFAIRAHAGWTGETDNNGNPVYSSDSKDMGYSYFPGYAINQETGERLNIVFGESSWLSSDNGNDMIWNPTSTILDNASNVIFGGRHYVYISKSRYDGCASLESMIKAGDPARVNVWRGFMWMGIPLLNSAYNFLPLKDGLIPTETRLRFRVTRPYTKYIAPGITDVENDGYPVLAFNTNDLAPSKLSDAGNPYGADKQKLLDRIHAVPNPYYAYSAYQINRLDTRVRIINLPKRATINIYSLDGTLVRRLEKDDQNKSFIDWDVRNAKGLPIASGMYLMHVNAEGIGETVLRWFGAMPPVDVTNY